MEWTKIYHCLKCKTRWETTHYELPCPNCGSQNAWGELGNPVTGKQATLDEWARGSRPIRNTKDGSPPLGGELSD